MVSPKFRARSPEGDSRRRVLITGAAGRIGSGFAAHVSGELDLLLTDLPSADRTRIAPYGEYRSSDLSDVNLLRELCLGVHTVVHLAGTPSPNAAWAELLNNNIIGTYNLFVAAQQAGCHRIIYASSVHTVSGYPADRQIRTADPVNPGDLYGVSKCFGEALARWMAVQKKISVIVVRIGAFPSLNTSVGGSGTIADVYVSPDDLYQLLLRCIQIDGIPFGIFHGTSNNAVKRLDLADTVEILGYRPAYPHRRD